MKQRVFFLLLFFVVWLPIFAFQRPMFMLYQGVMAEGLSPESWLQVVRHGMLLDCTVAGYLTVIPLLCVLLSVWFPGEWLHKTMRWYVGVASVIISVIFVVDMALYHFWKFRLDATPLFYMQSPKEAVASVPYRVLFKQFVLFILSTFAIWWVIDKLVLTHTPEKKVGNRLWSTVVVLVLGGLLFLPIRGGITTSTANVGMVYFSKNQFLNHAAINPCFSLLASLSKQSDFASQFNYLPEAERAETVQPLLYTPDPAGQPGQALLTTTRPNVLIILLESFSASVMEAAGGEAGVTPHLNKLAKEGILFTNMYANSFRTDRGIVSVLNGYLAQPTTSIMKYPSKSQTLPSIAKSLGKEGYTADMLYGGDINFTNMRSYFYSSGYSRIIADSDFPIHTRLSKWGANDDVTFMHLYESIRDRDQSTPWLTTFLTLSSHEPFEVPYKRLEGLYPNSVAFTDSCLGDFIDKVKKLPVWKDLLVVLVSDHGFRYPDTVQEFAPERFHIPMLWLGGAVKQPMKVETFAVQTDLAATLLRQLHLPVDGFTFSKDIFDPSSPHYAFYTFPNGFGFMDTTGVSVFDNDSRQLLLDEPKEGNDLRLRKGKALLQTLYDDLGGR